MEDEELLAQAEQALTEIKVKQGLSDQQASVLAALRIRLKGSASKSLDTSPTRVTTVRYRRPHGTKWEDLDIDTALEMNADRVLEARRKTGQETDAKGRTLRRTMGIASLGGATLDNEENYLMKKLYTAMGAIQIETQARI